MSFLFIIIIYNVNCFFKWAEKLKNFVLIKIKYNLELISIHKHEIKNFIFSLNIIENNMGVIFVRGCRTKTIKTTPFISGVSKVLIFTFSAIIKH